MYKNTWGIPVHYVLMFAEMLYGGGVPHGDLLKGGAPEAAKGWKPGPGPGASEEAVPVGAETESLRPMVTGAVAVSAADLKEVSG